MLDPGVLRVRLDDLEGGLRAHPLDLEFGHEGGEVAGVLPKTATGRSVARKLKPVK